MASAHYPAIAVKVRFWLLAACPNTVHLRKLKLRSLINPTEALAHLLEPFGIQPRNHRTGPDTVVKGHYQEDFQKSWTRHLLQTCGHLLQTCGTAAPGCGDGSPVAADLQNPSTGISGQQLTGSGVASKLRPVAKSQKLAASPVAANVQSPSPATSGQQPAASSQQPTRPMWGADWTPPPTPFAGNVKKEGIGYRIIKKTL